MSGQTTPAVPFTQVPAGLLVPMFYVEMSTALTTPGATPPTVLIIGQATAANAEAPVYVASVAAAQAMFGVGSQLANMIGAYRAADPLTQIWALPLADAPSATKATGQISVGGTPSQNGTLALYIAGTLVNVPIVAGQTSAQVASAIQAAIAAVPTLPVTAAVSLSTVTLTANNAGTLGNDCPIVLNYLGPRGGQVTPAGLTVTITQMTGGATDPALSATTLAAAVGQTPYDLIVNPYAANGLAATTGLLSNQGGRWSPEAQVYGHAITASRAAPATLIAAAGALNDPHLSYLGVNINSPTPAWLWAAAFAGAIYPSLQNQPNQPLYSLPIPGVLPEPAGSEIGWSNQQALLAAGCALATRTATGGAAVLRAVTTYLTNAAGVPDQSAYLDIERLFTLMAVMRRLRNYVLSTFGRALLAANGTPTANGIGAPIATPTIIKNGLIGEYKRMEVGGLVQQSGAFAQALSVQPNATDPTRVDVLYQPDLVSGLYLFAVLNQFYSAA